MRACVSRVMIRGVINQDKGIESYDQTTRCSIRVLSRGECEWAGVSDRYVVAAAVQRRVTSAFKNNPLALPASRPSMLLSRADIGSTQT